ncbi:MAG: hypothetical protein JW795_05230 [Chitinivibrionales bacterium]|nr:hypothetical protein [Chitinivibrionales bacterium]
MITPMRKLTVLLYHKEKEQFLQSLQKLGVIHIVESPETGRESTPEKLQRQAETIKFVERMIKTLSMTTTQQSKADGTPESLASIDAEKLLSTFSDCEKQLEELEQSVSQLEKNQSLLAPWGDWEPQCVLELGKHGIVFRFFETSEKKFESLDTDPFCCEVINRRDEKVYFTTIQFNHEERPVIDADEVQLPPVSLFEISNRIEHHKKRKKALHEQLCALATAKSTMEEHLRILKNNHAFDTAAYSMTEALPEAVVCLSGWFPLRQEKAVRNFFSSFTAWFSIDKPKQSDDVPVQLKNSRYASLFEPITRIFALPHYFELDPTPFFAPFFTLYVGLCLGDVGYGLIILCISIIASVKAPLKIRPYFTLLMVLSVSMIICGVLLNGMFGQTIFGGPHIPSEFTIFADGAQYICPLSPRTIGMQTDYPVMTFAIMIGFIQVILGMLLRTINNIRNSGVLSGLHPFSFICIIVGGLIYGAHTNTANLGLGSATVGPLRIGSLLQTIPLNAGLIFLIGGLIMLVLFNNPGQRIILRISVLFLWEMYGFVTGILGDVLSYLRLFALGLAGTLLGSAFNYIAFLPVTHDGTVQLASPFVIVTILVLLIGHTLNILLCMIGSFVHPLRLTFVEFYKNLNFKGGGKDYSPFLHIPQTKQIKQ